MHSIKQCVEDYFLLECIQAAYRSWKKAEIAVNQDEELNVVLRDRNRKRAECMKTIYRTLLLEAREKGLSLTTEQLLNRILYPCPNLMEQEGENYWK